MATAKKTTRKLAASKTTARKPVAARKLAGKVKGLQDSIIGTANSLLKSGRKDLDALVKVNKRSFGKLQSLVKQRTGKLKNSIHDWQSAAMDIDVSNPKASISRLDALSKDAFRMALDNIRDLADLAAKSQNDAFKIVRKNIEGYVSEVKKLLKK